MIQHIVAGKVGEARKTLDRHMPLAQLTGWLCEGACREHCLRHGLDAGINLPLLERYILQNSRSVKPFPMPASANRIATVGTSLAALVLAFDLSRKGHKVTLYETGPRGGALLSVVDRMPEGQLEGACSLVSGLGNSFEEAPAQTPDFLAKLLDENRVVFIDQGDPTVNPRALGLSPEELIADPVTRGSVKDRVFLAPASEIANPFLEAAAAGKKTVGSLDRLFQGVQPGIAREREEVFQTTLVVDTSDAIPIEPVIPADPLEFTPEEAKGEAARCLNCTCQICLSVCPHLRHYKGYPKKYAREMYNNVITAYGIHTANILVLSCAECNLCKEVCPNQAEVTFFVQKARKFMVDTNHMPAAAHEYALEDLLSSNAPGTGFFRLPPGENACQKIFYPGCQLVASRPQTTAQTYEYLNKTLKGVGLMSGCCGAPAKWSGRSVLTGTVAGEIKKVWSENGQPTFILACPSCSLFFKTELPEINTESLWEVLAGIVPDRPTVSMALTLHDPCASRYEEGIQKGARKIISSVAPSFSEQKYSGRLTKCCGYGGLAAHAQPELGMEYSIDTAQDGDAPLVSYCIVCRDRFKAAGFPSLHLLDLLFPEGDLSELMNRPMPNLSEKRDRRLDFRQQVLKSIWQEEVTDPPKIPYEIVIPPEIYELMEKRRILKGDVEAVIAEAAVHGPLFLNRNNGHSLASLRPRQVTFWVEYTIDEDGRYLVHQVWCHRMVAPGVPGEGAESPATLEGYARTGGRV
jgi:Fe-S oxidoreductase